MKIFNKLNITKKYKNSTLAIGNFDGVHKGHQKVFEQAKKYATKKKIKFGVLTFTPMPLVFFNKKITNHKIVSENQKFILFKKYKVDFVLNIKFNKNFSKIYAKDFIEKIIYKKINPKQVFVSNNFKFGNRRKGNVNLLAKFGKTYNYNLLKINPDKYEKKMISSTRIRKYIQKGKFDLANKLLTRVWSIEGRVIKGRKLGRKLGFRTCNIRIKNYVLPMAGIYAVKVMIGNKKKLTNGVAYLGSRPTFKGKEIFLEINIFNFKGNLYKKKLKVFFLKFIRRDRKFGSSKALIKQMNKDVILAKKSLKPKLAL